MAQMKGFMSEVKELLKNSPLAANSCFGFILVGLEKIMETEFSCPCKPASNFDTALLFFIVPALIVFMLTCSIQVDVYMREATKSCCKALMHSVVPAMLWVIILFIDGRYYACAKTSWSGKYEVIEKAPFQRWCNPSNSSLVYVTDTQKWYTDSQYTGIWTAFGLAVCCLFIFCLDKYKTRNTTTNDNPNPLQPVTNLDQETHTHATQ